MFKKYSLTKRERICRFAGDFSAAAFLFTGFSMKYTGKNLGIDIIDDPDIATPAKALAVLFGVYPLLQGIEVTCLLRPETTHSQEPPEPPFR
jgi:hypothetical protein